MNNPAAAAESSTAGVAGGPAKVAAANVKQLPVQIVDIVSDSGEGAQTAGQLFGTISARMGNGVWTVEIIPAEIEPPPRSTAGASGVRIRFGTEDVTNMGDAADLVVAFNEQVLYSRIDQNALRKGTVILLDDHWGTHIDPSICEAYATAVADFKARGYIVKELPMDPEVRKFTDNPRRGKNIWVVGMLTALYSRDYDIVAREVAAVFERKRKGQKIIDMNLELLEDGYAWGMANLDERFDVPAKPSDVERVVMNGNAAVALGAMAAGFEICSMYPITPATAATHFMATVFHKTGGFIHQAEDEIAACGFAIGASYAGKTALTVTSGPGMALKTEMIGLAIMTEIPLVIVDVQRGGPSTGLPTKVEQGDLLHALFAHTGDAPKIVMAASTIGECFHFMVTARQLAEEFRMPVIVLTDANLATGQCPFPYPDLSEDWLSPPVDQSDWDPSVRPYEWDEKTGLSPRPIPGQKNGHYVLTGLAHDEDSHVAYESAINQHAMYARSKKMATVFKSLQPVEVFGGDEGDLLVVGWGSTRGAIEEAVMRFRKAGKKVSAMNIKFLSPLQPGVADAFKRFKNILAIEINYSDDRDDPNVPADARRYAQLTMILRAQTLADVDCWSRVPGYPISPGEIEAAIADKLKEIG